MHLENDNHINLLEGVKNHSHMWPDQKVSELPSVIENWIKIVLEKQTIVLRVVSRKRKFFTFVQLELCRLFEGPKRSTVFQNALLGNLSICFINEWSIILQRK